jgi:hypothetical protein
MGKLMVSILTATLILGAASIASAQYTNCYPVWNGYAWVLVCN